MFIHVFLAFPETAGRPLEEVTELFEQRIPAWKTGNSWSRVRRAEQGDIEDFRGSVSGPSKGEKPREPDQKSEATDASPNEKPVQL
jgi:hypothetical protein